MYEIGWHVYLQPQVYEYQLAYSLHKLQDKFKSSKKTARVEFVS